MPFYRFFFLKKFRGPTKIDYRKKGTLILTSLLEDHDLLKNVVFDCFCVFPWLGLEGNLLLLACLSLFFREQKATMGVLFGCFG